MKKNYRFKMRTDQPDKNGDCNIMLVVTKNRKRIFISLNIFGNPDFWDETQQQFAILDRLRKKTLIKENDKRKVFNKLLSNFDYRAEKVIKEFETKKIDWTLNQFKDVFLNIQKQSKIEHFFKNHIKILKETNRIGNANSYESTLHILNLFDNRFSERVFGEIDLKYVEAFDIWLQKRSCKGNTRKFYMKALRAIWNKAKKYKEAPASVYPFGLNGFSVNELSEKTEKRYLPTEYLDKLKTTTSKIEVNEFARNVFLLSYYLYGMSFIDMALLQKQNIVKLNKGKYIVYKRYKTKNQSGASAISIKITPEIEKLIQTLSQAKEPLNGFILPLVTVVKDNIADQYEHITNRRKKYGIYLKALASEFEFEFNLTSYVSRHTMAMQLQANNIPEAIISQVLGHGDLKTTKTYLDSLDTSVIDAAGNVL